MSKRRDYTPQSWVDHLYAEVSKHQNAMGWSSFLQWLQITEADLPPQHYHLKQPIVVRLLWSRSPIENTLLGIANTFLVTTSIHGRLFSGLKLLKTPTKFHKFLIFCFILIIEFHVIFVSIMINFLNVHSTTRNCYSILLEY